VGHRRDEPPEIGFALDSSLEEDGFEPSVPLTKYVDPSQRIRRSLTRRGEVPLGTLPSSILLVLGADAAVGNGTFPVPGGSNPLFHLPQDRWPRAVDAAVVSGVAAAVSCLVVRLTN